MRYTIVNAIGEAWQQFLEQMVAVLPHVLAALLVFALGVVVALVVSTATNRLLSARRLDTAAERLGLAMSLEVFGVSSSVSLLAATLKWGIIFLASILSLYSLDARLASDLAEQFFLYLPHLVVAILIIGAGLVLSRFLARSALIAAVNAQVPAARLLAGLTRAGVIIVAAAMAFEHLGVGRVTVLAAFGILFGGATLAVSIAVGLTLQEIVRRWLLAQFPAPSADPGEPIGHW